MNNDQRLKEIALSMRRIAAELEGMLGDAVPAKPAINPELKLFWIRDRNGTELPHTSDPSVRLHQARNPEWKEQGNFLSVTFHSNREGSEKQYRASCWDKRLQDVIRQSIDNKIPLELFIKPSANKGWLNVVGVATK